MIKNSTKETIFQRLFPPVIFFIFYFLYFYLLIDPRLRFYAHTTLGDLHLFTQKEVLLLDLWKGPGQLSLLVADFILKHLIFRWFGPALFTLSAVCLFWITKRLAASMGGKEVKVIPYLPVLLTFVLPVEHDFIYVYILPFYLALSFAALYVYLPNRAQVRVPFLLLFAAIVYFFGENVLFVFCAACFVYEIFRRRSFILGTAIVAAAILIPFISTTFVWTTKLHSWNNLHNYLWADFSRQDFIALFVFLFSVPVAMLLAWILHRMLPGHEESSGTEGVQGARTFSWRLGTLLFASLAFVGALFLFDDFLNSYLRLMAVSGPRLWIHEETLSVFPGAYGILILIEIGLALLASWLIYVWHFPKRPKTRLSVFLILSLVNCYLFGVFVVLFAVGCILYEWLYTKKYLWIPIQIIAALVSSVVFALAAGRDWIQAFVPLNPFLLNREYNEGLVVLKILRFFPLLMTFSGIWIAWGGIKKDGRDERSPFTIIASISNFLRRPLGSAGIGATSVFILVTASLVMAGMFFDVERHARFRLNYMARTGQWDKVLPEVCHLSSESLSNYVLWDINRALYQTGRMSDDFLIVPQNPDGLFPNWGDTHGRLLFAETWFELGLISPAEEVAYQILAEGKHPLVLLLLAKIHLVKNQTNTARVFLRALEREPGCASWAKPYLNYCDHIPTPPVDEEIKHLQEQMFKGESLMETNSNSLSLVETILKENPKNRMAFEYWMTFNMLMLREKKLAVSFHLLSELGVPGNHRLYQQAYLLMRKDAPKAVIDSVEIEPCTRESFARFTDAYDNRGSSEPLDAVYNFRNTYFYLDLFVESMRSR
jgi:hypothetical protein